MIYIIMKVLAGIVPIPAFFINSRNGLVIYGDNIVPVVSEMIRFLFLRAKIKNFEQ